MRLSLSGGNSMLENTSNIFLPSELTEYLNQQYLMLSEKFGCTYLSYYVESKDKQYRLNYNSSASWQKIFIQEGLIDHCPLVAIGRRRSSVILPWDSVISENKKQKEVCGIRSEHNIDHGLSFSTSYNFGEVGFKEMCGLATDRSNPNFYIEIMQDPAFVYKLLGEVRDKALTYFFTTLQFDKALSKIPKNAIH